MTRIISFGAVSQLDGFAQQPINFSAAGDNVIVAGLGGQIVRLFRITFVVGGATNLEFKDGTSIVVAGPYPLAANQSFVLDYTFVGMPPWFTTSMGNALIINSSNAVQIGGAVDYTRS
jgi:hypothetical protein